MRIILRNTDKAPIYEQIKEQIKQAILSDELLEILSDNISDGDINILFSTRITTDLEKIADDFP
jgi:GntR family transcriptional regulator